MDEVDDATFLAAMGDTMSEPRTPAEKYGRFAASVVASH